MVCNTFFIRWDSRRGSCRCRHVEEVGRRGGASFSAPDKPQRSRPSLWTWWMAPNRNWTSREHFELWVYEWCEWWIQPLSVLRDATHLAVHLGEVSLQLDEIEVRLHKNDGLLVLFGLRCVCVWGNTSRSSMMFHILVKCLKRFSMASPSPSKLMKSCWWVLFNTGA